MIRIQVELSPKQLEAVRRLALAEGSSVSDVVREAVDAIVYARAGTSREEAKALSLAAVGTFRSGRKDLPRENDLPERGIRRVTTVLVTSGLLAILAADDAGHKGLSLVDCTSFEVMRRHGLRGAFAPDADFARHGFELVPTASDRG